jgi:DNA polymerase V
MHIYSIDEVFLDMTSYLSYYKKDIYTLAKMILSDIASKTGIYATCGIGKNMLLAKLALDIEAKKAKDFIASWDYADIPHKLWTLPRLSDMWGIGTRTEHHLNRLGIQNIYDLAHTDPKLLRHHFGIIGEEMYYHAHGIDMSRIQEKTNVLTRRKSYGQSQVLFRDYFAPDIFIIIRETVDEVSRRLRMAHKAASTVSLGIGYSSETGGGFGRQYTFNNPTMHASTIYHACIMLFQEHDIGLPIRRIHVSVTNLVTPKFTQMSLFEDQDLLDDELNLYEAVDYIKHRYGKNAVNRASSLLPASTIQARNHMVGGHHE